MNLMLEWDEEFPGYFKGMKDGNVFYVIQFFDSEASKDPYWNLWDRLSNQEFEFSKLDEARAEAQRMYLS